MIKNLFGRLKSLIVFVWLLLLVLLGAKIAQQNSELLQVELLMWQLPAVSSGVVITVAVLIGALIGVLAVLPSFFLLKFKVRRLRSQQHTPSAPARDSQTPHVNL